MGFLEQPFSTPIIGFPTGQNHEFIPTKKHDFMGMLPSPHEAEKRGLAPKDIFPHKSTAKIPVLNDGVSHHKLTSYPKNHENCHHEFMAL